MTRDGSIRVSTRKPKSDLTMQFPNTNDHMKKLFQEKEKQIIQNEKKSVIPSVMMFSINNLDNLKFNRKIDSPAQMMNRDRK